MGKAAKVGRMAKKATMTTMVVLLKTVKWFVIIGIIIGFIVGGAAVGYVAALVKDEPIREEDQIIEMMQKNAETGYAYFRDGSLIGQLRTDEDRILVEFNEIPSHVIDAFLAVEDNDFYEHVGIDLSGIMRAVKQRVFNEPFQTGGSTITQQLARRVFMTLDQTDSRKAKEIFLSMRLERYMSKEEILQAYLNKMPFGNGSNGYSVFGIKAAAKGIFDIEDLNELHIAQAAYLAGLLQSPSAYSAFTGMGEFNETRFERAMERQRHVLSRMLTVNRITQQQYDEALRFDVKASLAEEEQRAYNVYPFLMIEVERRATETLALMNNPELTKEDLRTAEYSDLLADAKQKLLTEGYHVHTTIDKDMYLKMQEIAQNPDYFHPDDPEKGIEQIGAILLDNETSAILALIEGRDFYQEQLNHATQMERQPGSMLKPISAFLPALESGAIQPGTPVDDVPIVLPDGGSRGYHIPQNWNLTFNGIITARHALNQSFNIPAVRLFNEVVGIEEAWEFTRSLGITTLTESDNHALTGVIGGLEYGTTVEELTNAYTSIPSGGNYKPSYMIERIDDSQGNIVYEHKVLPDRVFSEQTAYLMVDMLRTVITSGTGTSILNTFNHYGQIPVSGKTGSTQLDRDAWFVGFSPDITVGVWAGYDQNHTLSLRSSLPQGPGTQRAKNIWSIIMDEAIQLKPEWFATEEFERPEGIVSRTVSRLSGKLPSSKTTEAGENVTDLFNEKYVPVEEDDALVEMSLVNYNGRNFIPHPETPEDMVFKRTLVKRPEPLNDILDDIENKLKNTPTSGRQTINNRPVTLSDYFPRDMERTAPEKVDPREDTGQAPSPPTNLRVVPGDGRIDIHFDKSESENVVGYRLYRSMNGSPFSANGRTVLNGQDFILYDYVSDQHSYAHYIVAVDIVGRQSEPSEIVTSGGAKPPFDNDEERERDDEEYEGEDRSPADRGRGDRGRGDRGRGDEQPEHNNGHNDEEQENSVPSAPSGLSVAMSSDGLSIEVNWNESHASERVRYYEIQYSSEQNGRYRRIGNSGETVFETIALPAEGWYRVIAHNDHGASQPSSAVELKSE